jgi:hypothetical protein
MHFSFMKKHLKQEPILRMIPAFNLAASDNGPFRLPVFVGDVLFVALSGLSAPAELLE